MYYYKLDNQTYCECCAKDAYKENYGRNGNGYDEPMYNNGTNDEIEKPEMFENTDNEYRKCTDCGALLFDETLPVFIEDESDIPEFMQDFPHCEIAYIADSIGKKVYTSDGKTCFFEFKNHFERIALIAEIGQAHNAGVIAPVMDNGFLKVVCPQNIAERFFERFDAVKSNLDYYSPQGYFQFKM